MLAREFFVKDSMRDSNMADSGVMMTVNVSTCSKFDALGLKNYPHQSLSAPASWRFPTITIEGSFHCNFGGDEIHSLTVYYARRKCCFLLRFGPKMVYFIDGIGNYVTWGIPEEC